MPANRSRTTEWRRCLDEIVHRNGAIEIAVVRPDQDDDAEEQKHLVWRVRMLERRDNELIVEQPTTLGQTIELRENVNLVAIFTIGQNRWMFKTSVLGKTNFSFNGRGKMVALRLKNPEKVERCQRRRFYRVDTVTVNLPRVQIWPLLDPKTVAVAERANEINFTSELNGNPPSDEDLAAQFADDAVKPELGPQFSGELINLGGGGIGLRVGQEESHLLNRTKMFWIRFALPPELSTPICATGKLVHSHMDSTQDVYAGLVFDFTFNPSHQRFVADQICKFVAAQQRAQLQRSAA
ncbi:MAG: flagellar brake domain-containing protein [Planctomycetota bacterium]